MEINMDFKEKFRPQYHVSPQTGWLNDPNGMVYYKGKYHLFYQYYPHGKFPTDEKHWAHVVSNDLANWEQLPVAIQPDKYGSIWSGGAVADLNNHSGLFSDTTDKAGLIAFYTNRNPDTGEQRQCMAYSKDDGITWIKYNDGAPIIDCSDDPLSCHDFRDPKVFWHQQSGKWMMVVAGGPLRFYSSKNLIDWKPEGMQDEIHTECPDFFSLPVNGDQNNKKWVLSGCGVWYMVGDFKEENGVWKFFPQTDKLPFNNGPDVYAAQTFDNAPDGRVIKVDWMMAVGYCINAGHITDPYSGALTLPYELDLITIDNSYKLTQSPVKELETLRLKDNLYRDLDLEKGVDIKGEFDKAELLLDISVDDKSEFEIILRASEEQQTIININTKTQTIIFDRTKSGANVDDPNFCKTYSAKIIPEDGRIKLHIYIDWSSVELFAQDGKEIFTVNIFPDQTSKRFQINHIDGKVLVNMMNIIGLKSIYDNKKGEK